MSTNTNITIPVLYWYPCRHQLRESVIYPSALGLLSCFPNINIVIPYGRREDCHRQMWAACRKPTLKHKAYTPWLINSLSCPFDNESRYEWYANSRMHPTPSASVPILCHSCRCHPSSRAALYCRSGSARRCSTVVGQLAGVTVLSIIIEEIATCRHTLLTGTMRGMLYCAGSQSRILCRTIFSSLAHSGATGWMAMTFGTDIDGSQSREPSYFGDPLTLPPAPVSVWYGKSLDSWLVYKHSHIPSVWIPISLIILLCSATTRSKLYFVQYFDARPNSYKTNDISHFCPPWKCQSISRWWIMLRLLHVTQDSQNSQSSWGLSCLPDAPSNLPSNTGTGSKSNTYRTLLFHVPL